ncbi:MAG: hypothetical protein JRI90_18575 [Deltaproteobacteria bacterium]|nr:hypothetical protein [Deltaproteobacteria bacterium]
MYGKKIKVLGKTHHHEELKYIISLPDGTHAHLPSWMTQAQAGFFSIVEIPVVSLDALQRLKMVVDTALHFLHHDQKNPHDGGEDAHNKIRTAVGPVLPDASHSDQDSTENKAKDPKPPCRFDGRGMDVEQRESAKRNRVSRRSE